MPTASPIMTASIGAVFETGANAATTEMPPNAAPTPTSAVRSGMPAESSDPNVITSTTPANITPSNSVVVRPKSVSWNTSPPNATTRPASRAVSPVAVTSSIEASVTSLVGPSNCTWMYAVRASSDTWLPAYWSNGPSTLATPSTPSSSPSIAVIAERYGSPSTDSPSGASTTAFTDAPAVCGNTAASLSMAAWDSVPGIVYDSSSWPPRPMPAPRRAVSATAHAAMTSHARRKANRPIRCRKRATDLSQSVVVAVARGCGRREQFGDHRAQRDLHLVVGQEVLLVDEGTGRGEQERGAAEGDAEPDLVDRTLALIADRLGESPDGGVGAGDDRHLREARPLDDEHVHRLPVGHEQVDDAVDEPLATIPPSAREELVEHDLELGDGRLDGGPQQCLLRREVVEHARLRVAGVVGDVLQRGGGESDGRELLERDLLELVGRAHALRRLGHPVAWGSP